MQNLGLPTNLGLSARGVERDAGNKSLADTTAADNLNRLLEAFRYALSLLSVSPPCV